MDISTLNVRGFPCNRYEKEGQPSQLAPVDVYVSTVDPSKEPPIVTANTILSILSVDYPVDKVSCYLSDDGAAMLTFEALSETSEFARKWVPFCKKFAIEPRAPEMYFAQKIDYLKDKVQPTFVKERRAMKVRLSLSFSLVTRVPCEGQILSQYDTWLVMQFFSSVSKNCFGTEKKNHTCAHLQREYEEFKVRVNALVAKAQKVPEEGWTMQDGTPWPGNNTRDHPGMIQVRFKFSRI